MAGYQPDSNPILLGAKFLAKKIKNKKDFP